MTGSRALETLVAGIVDYAGLFPPAALGMTDAVQQYARHASGPDRAMLGRFVLSVARLGEFDAAVRALRAAEAPSASVPWRLSVLAGASDLDALEDFRRTAPAHVTADTVEAKAESVEMVRSLAAVVGAGYVVYVELPVRDDPTALIASLQVQGMRAKIRTGGVAAEAFPTAAEVLRFLRRCHEAAVPFKATAGLHHPLRGEFALTYMPDSARGMMFGFLNLFLAATLLRSGASDAVLLPLLEERDPRALVVEDDGIRWRAHRMTGAQIADARATFAGSFGSCSFDEPARELPTITLAHR